MENISNPEIVVKKLEMLCNSHKNYEVKEEHYLLVQRAFLAALEY
ncbi:MAG: hemoglobin-like flavoprotein [Oceanospirillaceae bacterium]|jgi:hemoglobin-like flavoprotein